MASPPNNDGGALVCSLLSGKLHRGDCAELGFVRSNGFRHRLQATFLHGPLHESVIHPAAQRLRTPGGYGSVARLNERSIDGYGEPFFALAHTLMITRV